MYEVLEEGPVAHETGGRVEQRPTGVEPGLRHLAGAEQIRRGEARTAGLQAEPGEALEDDAGEVVPVADKVGEDADEQRLLHQAGHDVVVGAPTPAERRERHVDGDQGGGAEGALTARQEESRDGKGSGETGK